MNNIKIGGYHKIKCYVRVVVDYAVTRISNLIIECLGETVLARLLGGQIECLKPKNRGRKSRDKVLFSIFSFVLNILFCQDV